VNASIKLNGNQSVWMPCKEEKALIEKQNLWRWFFVFEFLAKPRPCAW